MTPEEFVQRLRQKKEDINRFIDDDAPKLVGKLAVDYFQENFRRGGFNGTPWKPPKRMEEGGKSAKDNYGPLLSSTDELMNSITYYTETARAIVTSDKVYAKIHNEGGTINVPVTPKMRKFFWAKHYEETDNMPGKGGKWKSMALTKKDTLKIDMPRRQFAGETDELCSIITEKLEGYLTRILD